MAASGVCDVVGPDAGVNSNSSSLHKKGTSSPRGYAHHPIITPSSVSSRLSRRILEGEIAHSGGEHFGSSSDNVQLVAFRHRDSTEYPGVVSLDYSTPACSAFIEQREQEEGEVRRPGTPPQDAEGEEGEPFQPLEWDITPFPQEQHLDWHDALRREAEQEEEEEEVGAASSGLQENHYPHLQQHHPVSKGTRVLRAQRRVSSASTSSSPSTSSEEDEEERSTPTDQLSASFMMENGGFEVQPAGARIETQPVTMETETIETDDGRTTVTRKVETSDDGDRTVVVTKVSTHSESRVLDPSEIPPEMLLSAQELLALQQGKKVTKRMAPAAPKPGQHEYEDGHGDESATAAVEAAIKEAERQLQYETEQEEDRRFSQELIKERYTISKEESVETSAGRQTLSSSSNTVQTTTVRLDKDGVPIHETISFHQEHSGSDAAVDTLAESVDSATDEFSPLKDKPNDTEGSTLPKPERQHQKEVPSETFEIPTELPVDVPLEAQVKVDGEFDEKPVDVPEGKHIDFGNQAEVTVEDVTEIREEKIKGPTKPKRLKGLFSKDKDKEGKDKEKVKEDESEERKDSEVDEKEKTGTGRKLRNPFKKTKKKEEVSEVSADESHKLNETADSEDQLNLDASKESLSEGSEKEPKRKREFNIHLKNPFKFERNKNEGKKEPESHEGSQKLNETAESEEPEHDISKDSSEEGQEKGQKKRKGQLNIHLKNPFKFDKHKEDDKEKDKEEEKEGQDKDKEGTETDDKEKHGTAKRLKNPFKKTSGKKKEVPDGVEVEVNAPETEDTLNLSKDSEGHPKQGEVVVGDITYVEEFHTPSEKMPKVEIKPKTEGEEDALEPQSEEVAEDDPEHKSRTAKSHKMFSLFHTKEHKEGGKHHKEEKSKVVDVQGDGEIEIVRTEEGHDITDKKDDEGIGAVQIGDFTAEVSHEVDELKEVSVGENERREMEARQEAYKETKHSVHTQEIPGGEMMEGTYRKLDMDEHVQHSHVESHQSESHTKVVKSSHRQEEVIVGETSYVQESSTSSHKKSSSTSEHKTQITSDGKTLTREENAETKIDNIEESRKVEEKKNDFDDVFTHAKIEAPEPVSVTVETETVVVEQPTIIETVDISPEKVQEPDNKSVSSKKGTLTKKKLFGGLFHREGKDKKDEDTKSTKSTKSEKSLKDGEETPKKSDKDKPPPKPERAKKHRQAEVVVGDVAVVEEKIIGTLPTGEPGEIHVHVDKEKEQDKDQEKEKDTEKEKEKDHDKEKDEATEDDKSKDKDKDTESTKEKTPRHSRIFGFLQKDKHKKDKETPEKEEAAATAYKEPHGGAYEEEKVRVVETETPPEDRRDGDESEKKKGSKSPGRSHKLFGGFRIKRRGSKKKASSTENIEQHDDIENEMKEDEKPEKERKESVPERYNEDEEEIPSERERVEQAIKEAEHREIFTTVERPLSVVVPEDKISRRSSGASSHKYHLQTEAKVTSDTGTNKEIDIRDSSFTSSAVNTTSHTTSVMTTTTVHTTSSSREQSSFEQSSISRSTAADDSIVTSKSILDDSTASGTSAQEHIRICSTNYSTPSPAPQSPSTSTLQAPVHSPSPSQDNFNVVTPGRSHRSSVDSGTGSDPSRPAPGHFVVVAIDFGTTFSGYAFSFTRDPDSIHMMRKWEGGDPGVINQKTPTTLLMTPDGKFHSFGFTARDFFHDLDPVESKNWLYFEKFKMALHYNKDLSKETMLVASNGTKVPAKEIFTYALKFFKEHALQELTDQSSTKILNEDVRWVLTVPAIWRAPAKQFMREAAYDAGIASSEYPDQLLIALEPEAASIYCRRLRLHQLVPEKPERHPLSPRHIVYTNPPDANMQDKVNDEFLPDDSIPDSPVSGTAPEYSFHQSPTVTILPANTETVGSQVELPGTRYMVVDCGGGTVDITVHEMEAKHGNLKELYKATGGPYGSVGLDMEFEKLLTAIFGPEYMEAFKYKRPAGYVDLMIAFESRKRAASPFKSNALNVSLPFSFIDYYKKFKGSQVEAAIRKYGDKEVRWSSQGMLRLTPEAMRRLFTPTVEKIKQAIGDVINNPAAKDIRYMFLVGGFAESPMLQHELRKEFGHFMSKIIIPQDVGLTILKGAVCFGLDPTVVNIRRCRMTYGVGVLNRFVHGKHPETKLVAKDGVEWCTDVFDRFVVADQAVALGDTVLRSYTPAKPGQKSSIINIYSSEKPNVKFITDPGVTKCGTLCLDLSDLQYQPNAPKRREIQARMIFGDTEIKVSALDVATGTIVRAGIDFLNK